MSQLIGQLMEKLPPLVRLICVGFLVIGSVYYIDRHGLVTFMLKLIFSP
jgi:hypothetical protein